MSEGIILVGKRRPEREQGNKQGEGGGGQVKSRGSEKTFFYEIRGLWWGGGSSTSLRLSYLLDYAS